MTTATASANAVGPSRTPVRTSRVGVDPARAADHKERPRTLRQRVAAVVLTPAFVVSAAIHAAVLTPLLFLTLSGRLPVEREMLLLDTSLETPRDLFENNAWSEELDPLLDVTAGGAPSLTDADQSAARRSEQRAEAVGGLDDPFAMTDSLADGASGSAAGSGGAGAGPGDQVGTADFLGVVAQGQKFVYLIDRSASMLKNGALAAAKRELIGSLHKLAPTMQFQVVFYNDQTRRLRFAGNDGLVPAIGPNIDEAARQIQGTAANNMTEHQLALEDGLALRPEVIFFLTDAEDAEEEMVERITQLNHARRSRQPASIHVIQFAHPNTPQAKETDPIHQLALRNAGTYRRIETDGFRPQRTLGF